MTRNLSLLALALVAVAVAGAGTAAIADRAGKPAVSPSRSKPAGLRLSGRVSGLVYPGVQRRLSLAIANRARFGVRVTSLRVRPVRGSRRCSPRNLTVKRARLLRLVVPARRARRVTLRTSLRRSAPDGCRGTRFRLSFRATGVRARGRR